MKKIVVLYPYETGQNAFSGGVPKVIVSNIIAINNNGDKPFLVLPNDNLGLITFVKNEYSFCEIIPVNFKSLALYSDSNGLSKYILIFKHLKGFIFGKRALKTAISKISPDIIHFHEVINFPLLNIYPKAKIVLHLHSYRFTGYGKMLNYILYLINKRANIIISPTNSILNALGEDLRVHSRVVNTPYMELKVNDVKAKNSEIVKEFKGYQNSGKIIFSFVGRICSIKRVDHFITALSKLNSNQRSKIIFSIVGGTNTEGDKDYKEKLLKLIAAHKLESVVKFHGYINPIEQILPLINYGVILSESEAVPMIGIEYMRFDIPIFGYKAPGISDFLVNNKNGFLIDNGSIESLTELLKDVLSCKTDNINFNESIPVIFKRHTIDEFTIVLDEVYKGLLI